MHISSNPAAEGTDGELGSVPNGHVVNDLVDSVAWSAGLATLVIGPI